MSGHDDKRLDKLSTDCWIQDNTDSSATVFPWHRISSFEYLGNDALRTHRIYLPYFHSALASRPVMGLPGTAAIGELGCRLDSARSGIGDDVCAVCRGGSMVLATQAGYEMELARGAIGGAARWETIARCERMRVPFCRRSPSSSPPSPPRRLPMSFSALSLLPPSPRLPSSSFSSLINPLPRRLILLPVPVPFSPPSSPPPPVLPIVSAHTNTAEFPRRVVCGCLAACEQRAGVAALETCAALGHRDRCDYDCAGRCGGE
ncbi:hypothetical protein C8R47DRAFT_1224078 [Mycena vitilis]|nr:hypothetical protein C8R47DRAFT_1224078 [Mycena vitilis]